MHQRYILLTTAVMLLVSCNGVSTSFSDELSTRTSLDPPDATQVNKARFLRKHKMVKDKSDDLDQEEERRILENMAYSLRSRRYNMQTPIHDLLVALKKHDGILLKYLSSYDYDLMEQAVSSKTTMTWIEHWMNQDFHPSVVAKQFNAAKFVKESDEWKAWIAYAAQYLRQKKLS
ncbi:Avirulence (Avh) protein [Phytophthora megakarya]|uniref:RxLR effector protein n=1 Tax=Phytophthora megakarya TaxID=4795 RepID=A0A225UA87_9STRA|nr:Avirulence (Avh) protein [Phytophthora megakarya]